MISKFNHDERQVHIPFFISQFCNQLTTILWDHFDNPSKTLSVKLFPQIWKLVLLQHFGPKKIIFFQITIKQEENDFRWWEEYYFMPAKSIFQTAVLTIAIKKSFY